MSFFAAACPQLFFALTSRAWEDLSDGASLLVVALVIVSGVLLGYALRGLVGRWQADSIERKTALRHEQAEAEIQAKLKEMDVKSRAAVVKAREDFEKSMKERRDELQLQTDRVSAREANLDSKATLLDTRAAALDRKADAAEKAAAEARAASEAAAAKSAEADRRLHALAKMTHDEARREVLARANASLRDDVGVLARRSQEAAREEAEAKARAIVADAVTRCAVSHLSELVTSSVPIAGEEMKGRIVGKDGRNLRAFEQATGVTLMLDEAPEMVMLSSFDPFRREVAKRALEELLKTGRIHPQAVEDAVAAAQAAAGEAAAAQGEAAAAEAGVPPLSPEMAKAVGMLAYRTSFSQNALRHSVEVALLSSVIASELGLDGARAARIGFLHDVGKILPSEQKGAHAQLGAEWLRQHGEDETTCLAVAAHHPESGVNGGIYGVICAAADAISAARPGARRETVANYLQRVQEVESVARGHAGVKAAYAVQAGRDLRVVVDPAEVTDSAAQTLAGEICREISSRITFPGVIRVTVVRELRCVEYAK